MTRKAPLTAAALFWMPCWVGAEVEVDRETGKVQVVHLVVGADSGRSVNTIACRGQVEGAALQALGQSLFEELRYEDGKPVNATPLDYRVPLARDLPDQYELFVLEHGGPGPFGAKGIGEAGMLGVASAIANAIEDAVGVRVTQIPFMPEGAFSPRSRPQAMTPTASLPMYNLPEMRAAECAVLGGLARPLARGGLRDAARDADFRAAAGADAARTRNAVLADLRLSARNRLSGPGDPARRAGLRGARLRRADASRVLRRAARTRRRETSPTSGGVFLLQQPGFRIRG